MKIKWGVIGCGGIAQRRTIPGMSLSDKIELVAVMDTSADAAKAVAEKYGAKYAFTSEAELLALDEIDAVYIASPVFCHKKQCEMAAKAKKHILLEKPMGLSIKESEQIAEICEREGVMLGVAFMMRFHAYHQKMREIIADGAIGEIVSASARFSCWYPEMENCWRQNKTLSGGGAMLDMAIHAVDLIRYITGLEIVDTTGFVGNQVFKYSVEDAGVGVYKMNNGAMCVVESAFNVPDEVSASTMTFYGTKGCIIANGTMGQAEGGDVQVLTVTDGGDYDASQSRSTVTPTSLDVTFGNMYQKEVEAFGEAILGKRDIPVSAKDAICSQKAIEALYN